ncbi:09d1a84e-e60f-4c78-bd52-9f712e49bd0a [Sclerotinia trifoliorum]|uniref:Maintenance of telomere capping protein 6 n=1 Tax=Sclerotinia trifoliorum TaxID=28548 RepID=A0A8H2W012_9HELO|nr:09d1a84e-e60f-4c78-bd52-9f712e49bd0a [Sclerotinia trifoliorum]
MSETYKPDTDALPKDPYDTAYLSQRDLGLNIPINYVTTPGISLKAACFPFLKYEDDDAAICISNLLADGFRRLEVDLYWDETRQLWSFCPLALPVETSSIVSSPIPTSTLPSTTARLTSASQTTDLVARQDTATSTIISSSRTRNTDSTSRLSSSSRTLSTVNFMTSSLEATLPTKTTVPISSNRLLYNIGHYTCTPTINLHILTTLLLDYIQQTQNTIEAHMLILTLNIHAIQSDASINGPAPQPANFPDFLETLGSSFSANLSAYIYTPNDLRSNRANLNASWYSVAERYRPALDYYSTTTNEFGVVSTEDGWPSESYVEFSQGKRMLLQFGVVDPQMKGYNFTGDSGTIFSPGYLSNRRESDILTTPDGNLTSGCFFLNTTEQVSQVNSSWATAASIPGFDYPSDSNSNLTPLLNLTSSLTNCGISPTLNTTLLNATVNTNNAPYKSYAYSTIWSWAPDEPRNSSSSSSSSTNDPLFRCATLRSPSNHWHVTDCSTKLYAACRFPAQPYNWTLTNYPISYSYASQACPAPYTFSSPRSALENTHLLQTINLLSASLNSNFNSDPASDSNSNSATSAKIWIDFNSLDTKNCWTAGGPNASCPYGDQRLLDDIREREVIVPVVAALIVMILTGLVLAGKCAGGRGVGEEEGRGRKGEAWFMRGCLLDGFCLWLCIMMMMRRGCVFMYLCICFCVFMYIYL